jgi:hypothetical protein
MTPPEADNKCGDEGETLKLSDRELMTTALTPVILALWDGKR